MANNDLYDLELLSLVTKISQELVNYLNLDDKSLAEFLISIHGSCNRGLACQLSRES
jgi:ATP-dependent RNA helicase DHX8/PRP22